jgi:hypothetical protein
MQKKIFEDLGPLHEAYVAGGTAEIERFHAARIIDATTLDAWRRIETGRRDGAPALVHSGNRALLFREQLDIIDRFYLRMLNHRPLGGPVFTYLLTLAGAPAIPGARSYPEQFPLTLGLRLGGRELLISTPLANGNIAVFANRWSLIDADTLPGYLAFLRDAPLEARDLVTPPVSRRVGRYRLLARAGRLVAAAVTHWDVRLSAAPRPGPPVGVRPTKPLAAAEAERVVIDLTTAGAREAALPRTADNRVWMNPDRRPVAIAALLPGGREFRADVRLAVLLSPERDAGPEELVLRLPAADLEATARLLTEYASVWGFPADAIARWRTGAEQRPSSDRDYSTHVFTGEPLDGVRVEFQVAHHVRDGNFVVAAIFSWSGT